MMMMAAAAVAEGGVVDLLLLLSAIIQRNPQSMHMDSRSYTGTRSQCTWTCRQCKGTWARDRAAPAPEPGLSVGVLLGSDDGCALGAGVLGELVVGNRLRDKMYPHPSPSLVLDREKISCLRGVSPTKGDAPLGVFLGALLGGSSQEPQLTGQRFRVSEFTAGAEHHPINARWAHVCWGAHDAVPLSSSVHTTSPLACTLVVNRRRAARIRLSTLCTDLLIEMWHAARCPCKHTYHEGRTSTQGSNAITPRASLQDMPAFATARPWVGSKAYKNPSKMAVEVL